MPADNASLLDTRVLSIAFTVSIAYSGFMTMAYFLIWYMVQQADRLREASKREHYEAMQTLQLQHMNERINEARQIKHNIRHHIQTPGHPTRKFMDCSFRTAKSTAKDR